MADSHPITPSPELVQQWLGDFFGCTVTGEVSDSERYLATQAARWGADQELEACSQWIHGWYGNGSREVVGNLYVARRPKPPSLAERAFAALSKIENNEATYGDADIISKALHKLQQYEKQEHND